jgi:Putative transposase
MRSGCLPSPGRYFPIRQPRNEDVAAILKRIVHRVAKVIVGFDDDLESEADALATLQAAEVERRLPHPEPFEQTRRGAFLDGFSLHAGVRIHASDRAGRERLCRYILRPPLALHRLSRGKDGRLLYQMKRPRHGSLWLSLTAEELLAKLATLVPPPRVHGLRYHGVFAPNASLRSRVIPEADPSDPAADEVAGIPDAPAGDHSTGVDAAMLPTAGDEPLLQRTRTYRVPWADLLKKVFAVDVLACPCGGRLQIIAFITETTVAKRILDHLGLDSRRPPVARAQAPPDVLDPAPSYDGADPTSPD